MSASVPLLCAEVARKSDNTVLRDTPVQIRLAILLALNLTLVAISFSVDNLFLPWRTKIEIATPGWCFVVGQAGVIGFVAVLALRGDAIAVGQALLAATLLAYAYALAGFSQVDPHRVLQYSQLLYRAVELGLVSVGGLIVGVATRMALCERLMLAGNTQRQWARHFSLSDLMFLFVVIAVGLSLVNTFLNHFDREAQILEVLAAIARSLPAVLPWLWIATQPRLSIAAVAFAFIGSCALVLCESGISWVIHQDEFLAALQQAESRAAGYAIASLFNGVVLRGMGFRWQRV